MSSHSGRNLIAAAIAEFDLGASWNDRLGGTYAEMSACSNFLKRSVRENLRVVVAS